MKSPLSSCGAVQSKFRAASVALVAAADCNSVSVGLDAGHYEGPLRIRLPVKLSPGASAEGAWSFEVPLPNPASQKLLSRCACLTHFPCALQLCPLEYSPIRSPSMQSIM